MSWTNWINNLKSQASAQQTSNNQMANQYNMLEQKINSGDNKGDFYQLLGSILSKQLENGNPNIEGYRQSSEGAINRGFNKSRTKMKEDLAGRGMGGSGAALAAMAQLGGERANALGDNDLQISEMDENYRRDTLARLLGLNAFSAGADQTQISNMMSLFEGNRNQYNINRDFQYREDNTPSDFGNIIGKLFEIGTDITGTGFMTNWGRGFGNS